MMDLGSNVRLVPWWRMQKTRSRSSCRGSMNLLSVLWLLVVCLAPGSQGQRLKESEAEQPGARVQLAESDAVCHQDGCYAVFLQKRTFREAGRSCRERGGTLATMHTEEAAGLVHELLSGMESLWSKLKLRLWIGLHRPPRQCSSTRPLRGFVWVTGDQDGQFVNWLREETPGTCAAPRCVAMTVHTSVTTREKSDNFRWVDGSCALPLDGYICQYNYKGMCHPLEDEGSGPATYSTPFHLVSTVLTFVPYASVATLPCPVDASDPDAPAEQSVLCTMRDDETVGWSRDAPLCPSSKTHLVQDWCSGDHGCEHFCQNTDTNYYCYCSEGFVIDEDGYGCKPDPLGQTELPELSSDSAGPTEQPHINEVCVEMGCEYNCVETARGVRCTCPPGYQMGPDGRRCLDVDECKQDPCPQLCVNIPGTFHCTCHSGYQMDDDGECVDVDECLDEGTCEGACENTDGSFMCQCNSGYKLSSAGECVDIDECVSGSPCQQQCMNYMGGYQCFCDVGYNLRSDGITCEPSPEDEEYSTLTPDPSDSAHIPIMDPDDIPWSTAFTPDPNFEPEANFNVDWYTEIPFDVPQAGDNHLNPWDALPPKQHQTVPSPTQKDNTGNEIGHDAKAGSRGVSGGGAETANRSPGDVDRSTVDVAEDAGSTAEVGGDGSDAGKQKHDKSWLLVALLVPLCVFLVVMLALGIVYCTSCAVDKSLSFSNCHRWILPSTPPERRDGKAQA